MPASAVGLRGPRPGHPAGGHGYCVNGRTRPPGHGYISNVCSHPDLCAAHLMARLGALAQAVDELAADSRAGLPPGEAASRIAGIWMLVEDLDPDLARCRARYGSTPAPEAAPGGAGDDGSADRGPGPGDRRARRG